MAAWRRVASRNLLFLVSSSRFLSRTLLPVFFLSSLMKAKE